MKTSCVLCHPSPEETIILQREKWRVILAGDAAFPGFCRVIWKNHVTEMTDLTPPERAELLNAVFSVEQAIRDVMRPDKVNLASLGNMAPHLHWHVIPRFADDTHFPESVWGKAQREPDNATLEKRRALLPELKAAIRRIP
ncbi:MAG: HIT family protein [Burkholderiaceae bacterium]|jgi:diadenosine tetraphosphate (Ap4A) HIT family hydrolase|nr:HIT family protein [Burkholderiaceae bacterium]